MRRILCWLLLAATLLGGSVARAQEPLIVGVDFVREALQRGALIWDVRPAADYAKGHIPGAVNIGDAAAVLRNENTEDFIAVEEIARILGAAGLDPGRELIVYGNQGSWNAYFARYTMRHFGGRSTRIFHDGIEGWTAAGLRLSVEPAKLPPVKLDLRADPGVSVSTREVIASLGRGDVQILDVRTPREFSGEDVRALRGGHIPGAANIPHERNWVDPATPEKLARRQVTHTAGMALKPVDQLRALYSGLDPQKRTIVYCQSGVRASQTAAVLQQLGFKDVRVYDSSWLGYGNTLDAPAANETFFNVGRVNSQIRALQRRIDELERALGAAKAAKK